VGAFGFADLRINEEASGPTCYRKVVLTSFRGIVPLGSGPDWLVYSPGNGRIISHELFVS